MKIFDLQVLHKIMLTFMAAIFLAGPQVAIAKPVTLTREYTYRASEADSKLTSRTIASEQVKRLLLEELGTFIVSNTELRDSALTKDEIVTYTSGWVATVIIEERWNGAEYYMKANIKADSDDVAKAIASMHDDREKSIELKKLREDASNSLKEIDRLRQELEKAKSSKKPSDTEKTMALMREYDLAVAGLAANEAVVTAFDGQWSVSLICEDTQYMGRPVKGYIYDFSVDVKDGKISGRYGQSAQPASLSMIGAIQQDGTVTINASGISSKNQKSTAGPTSSPYSYRMVGKFSHARGKAKRIESRPCEATFLKQ